MEGAAVEGRLRVADSDPVCLPEKTISYPQENCPPAHGSVCGQQML